MKKAISNSNGSSFALFDNLNKGEHTLTFTYNGSGTKATLQIPFIFTTE